MAAWTGWSSPGPSSLPDSTNSTRISFAASFRLSSFSFPGLRVAGASASWMARAAPPPRPQFLHEVVQVDEAMDLPPEPLLGEGLLQQVPHLRSAVAEELDLQLRPFADQGGDVGPH